MVVVNVECAEGVKVGRVDFAGSAKGEHRDAVVLLGLQCGLGSTRGRGQGAGASLDCADGPATGAERCYDLLVFLLLPDDAGSVGGNVWASASSLRPPSADATTAHAAAASGWYLYERDLVLEFEKKLVYEN
jgi:hypothetical protein